MAMYCQVSIDLAHGWMTLLVMTDGSRMAAVFFADGRLEIDYRKSSPEASNCNSIEQGETVTKYYTYAK